ncbi:23S rRNA (uracil(1939)-C(5))-methyltransferase RlmD [Ammoniphilus sp. CFH 90114]|uniref:23S rRNA (uracil(1939)-C(5))-methyltransferase RlmD n=1 Tax=Ammoniphilus sp. CFH 90114 TaxID=2493665 RepID=UPI00100EC3BB|nr:23S rRNA (uracil(1939)-C(5))-methyltransferase RlmD [Ammoniphilus sp. CFH 90114]RXT04926.1 23S rRNA (uracil(1939)-C(5))-methyltransferase RlmD [Ammoniphilus sp. CFH 90114]
MSKHATVPVTKNEEIELEITGLTHEGDGVGKVEGFTLFIPQALPGEKVLAKVLKVKKNFGFGKLVEVLEPSSHREAPPCPVYHQCGGCSLQHLAYDEQLRQKTVIVQDNLKRLGKIEHAKVHETLGMKDPWRYRNKAQVPMGEEEGGLIGGFYAQRSHRIINMESCLIQHEKSDEIVNQVKKIASSLGIRAYNEETGEGLLRHVVVKVGFKTGELMLVLITKSRKIPNKEELVNQLTKQITGLKSLVLNINAKQTNVIFGEETEVLWGEPYIYDYIGNVRFAISARSFYQVNPVQTEILYGKALEYADLTGNETVIDAYCGIGTISLFLAQKAKKVYGVEIVPEAIADAKRNARLNAMENVEFAVGEAEKIIPWWYTQGIRADVVVVDPPRKGCDETLLETLIQMKPERIVYVSCNPSTLARDLQILEQGGYHTQEVQPVDMFPHTFHVESVAWLKLKES